MIPSVGPSESTRDHLVREYALALQAYLAGGGGEAALSRAYELGRAAVANGMGVVELALLHHAAFAHVAHEAVTDPESLAAAFLAESLSPYEMTHRGFQEAAARLEGLNQALQRKNRELEEIADSLKRANDATSHANRELEAFSYSVSHDLRTPLRTIDGFSHVLLEDYAAQLDATGQDHLRRMAAAAQRMGQIIDDLLALSRVSRTALVRKRTDLTEIAHQVVEELRSRDPAPPATVIIAPNAVAEVDGQLLRIVLENLFGNAWKFTAKRQRRQIEFGVRREQASTVFFVRDNGAGFDMTYAERLFSPFQRLHTNADFPGTGIGLATVQRIISRHGGSVWAEGAVDRGAIVYFTLAPAEPNGDA